MLASICAHPILHAWPTVLISVVVGASARFLAASGRSTLGMARRAQLACVKMTIPPSWPGTLRACTCTRASKIASTSGPRLDTSQARFEPDGHQATGAAHCKQLSGDAGGAPTCRGVRSQHDRHHVRSLLLESRHGHSGSHAVSLGGRGRR